MTQLLSSFKVSSSQPIMNDSLQADVIYDTDSDNDDTQEDPDFLPSEVSKERVNQIF